MRKDTQEQFIVEYLLKHRITDACDTSFHDQYHERFGGKQHLCLYGASMVYKAQRLLSSMYRRGLLIRNIVSIIELQANMPNWVYVYELHPQLRIGLAADIIKAKQS